MPTKTVPVFRVNVRRDAHTTTPVEVPLHEIPILQTVFGEENVNHPAGGTVADNKLEDSDSIGTMAVMDGEFDRLAAKYGGNDDGLMVEQVYGKKAVGGLDKAIAAAAVDGAPTKKSTAQK